MFTSVYFVLTCAVVAYGAAVASPYGRDLHLPQDLQLCSRDTPELNSCLRSLLQSLIPRIAKGMKEIELAPIDPFEMKEFVIDYKNKEFSMSGKVNARDIMVIGLKDTEIRSVNANLDDPEKLSGELMAFVPEIKVNGKYKLQGQFLNMPVSGKGKFEVLVGNITAFLTAEADRIMRNGETYLDITKLNIDPVIGSLKLDAPTFFNGNRELSRTALRMVNQFWPVSFNYIKPYIQDSITDVVQPFINRIISRIPFDEMLPPAA